MTEAWRFRPAYCIEELVPRATTRIESWASDARVSEWVSSHSLVGPQDHDGQKPAVATRIED